MAGVLTAGVNHHDGGPYRPHESPDPSGLEMSPERASLPCRMKVEKTDASHVGPTYELRQLLQKRYVAV